MKLRPILLAVSLGISLTAAPYCDAPKPVMAELARARAEWDRPQSMADRGTSIRAILLALVEKYPDDIQANRRFQNDSQVPQDELIARYKKRLDSKPGDPLSTYFYGLTISNRDRDGSMKLFETALEKDPELAWAHIAIAYRYAYGTPKDTRKATEHVDAFFTLCPTSYDFFTNRMLAGVASPEIRTRSTAALRQRVNADADPDMFGIYEHLWMLEFSVAPPAQHEEVRRQVKEDIARIRRLTPNLSLARLRMIVEGLKQANDAEALQAGKAEILRLFPASADAADIVRAEWERENPPPRPDEPKEKLLRYWKSQYAISSEWIARWPLEPIPRANRFRAALQLKDLPAAEVKTAVDQLLNFLRGNETIYGFQPFAHAAAEEYLARGIYLNEIPFLAEDGLATVVAREAKNEPNNQLSPEMQKRMRAPLRAAAIGAVDLLAQVYLKTGPRDKAEALEARLEPLEADGAMETGMKWRAASHVAELAGRKMDAFVYLERMFDAQPAATSEMQRKKTEELTAELRRLWTAMGGSEKTWEMRREKTARVQEAKSPTDWKEPEKRMAAWTLTDMGGKQWSSDALRGKTVFVNVWATWCGPCRAEHPEFQMLHDRLKGRNDVVVLSFNVDDQVGMVKNYMDDGKYTFPVLLAAREVKNLVDLLSIPRNWVFDSKGAHQLEQIGFLQSRDWVERAIAVIEKAK